MRKTKKVVLLFDTTRQCGRGFLFGIAKYSRLHGPWELYREPVFYRSSGKKKKLSKLLAPVDANGMILGDVEKVQEQIKTDLPTITLAVREPSPDTPNIFGDNQTIGKMAAEHFLDRGFRYFAYCGFDRIFWSEERKEVFLSRLGRADAESFVFKQPGGRGFVSWEKEKPVMIDWLKSLPKPVGLLACNDDRSRLVAEACRAGGIHVPEEVAILGVDNDELVCITAEPPLSSIGLNFEKAGYEAAAMLDKLMSGRKVKNKSIILGPTSIVTRQSTDIIAITDSEVAEAVKYIREHAKEPIQIIDIVNNSGLSRRTLQRKFKKILGRSINDEIKRVQTEQICRMLVETDMSVYQIALQMKYTDAEHIARYFHRATGMSPRTYRSKYSKTGYSK